MDVERKLMVFHGAARFADLVSTSREARDLRRAVDAGTVIRHVRGVYALPNADLAVVAARWCRGRITGETALELIPGYDADDRTKIHIEVPRNCSIPRKRRLGGLLIVAHRHAAGIHPDPGDPPVVPLARAIAQMFRGRDLTTAVAAADLAMYRGLVTREDIRAELTGRERRLVAWAVENINERAASPLESTARLHLTAAGYRCEVNPQVPDVGFVDLLVEGRVVVELDGFAYHSDRTQFQADRQRDRTLQLRGLPVLRYARDDVVGTPRSIPEEVGRLLHRGTVLPSRGAGPPPSMGP